MKLKLPSKTTYFTALVVIAGLLLYWPAKEEITQAHYPRAFPVLEKEGFALCYDGKNKVPLWVWERLDGPKAKVASRKNAKFASDPQVYPRHKSALSDYKGSGYDRGHLSPARHHTDSKQGMSDSFLLSNICPMPAAFNRGIWSELESYVASLSEKGLVVTVVSGPLFLEKHEHISYELIGKNRVAVPTHFFKVVHTKNEAGETHTQVFVINAHSPAEKLFLDKAKHTPNPEVIKTLDYLETVSGIVFEPDFHS